ncbi:tRNA:m(4)X modification protein [Acrasis kona]|uniref:tRNA:m(4)X modification enzyme TRM13 n=1 Tax=Acrasis kona TaxID=1008807 RepID=A0AAW2Z5E7_9EUKA
MDNSDRCTFITKKGKWCKFKRAPNQTHCHTHGVSGEKRIPCPVDPSHTIYEHDIQRHLKKCNTNIKIEQLVSQPYFQKNVNQGRDDDTQSVVYLKRKYLNLQPKTTRLSQMLEGMTEQAILSMAAKVKLIYEEVYKDYTISKEYSNDSILASKIESNMLSVKHGGQHLRIIDLLRKSQCLSSNVDYIEFGCGSANLSLAVKQGIDSLNEPQNDDLQQYILIDRTTVHNKSDSHIQYRNDHGEIYAQVDRITIDIAHLVFDKLPFKHDPSRACAISKHLCGIATDLTLKCLTSSKHQVKGIFIALCCHHCTSYHSYPNAEYLNQHNITEQDYECYKLLSSWDIVFKDHQQEEPKQQQQGLSPHEKYIIGNRCKVSETYAYAANNDRGSLTWEEYII